MATNISDVKLNNDFTFQGRQLKNYDLEKVLILLKNAVESGNSGLTQDILDALNGASSPSGSNVFATLNDIVGGGGSSWGTIDGTLTDQTDLMTFLGTMSTGLYAAILTPITRLDLIDLRDGNLLNDKTSYLITDSTPTNLLVRATVGSTGNLSDTTIRYANSDISNFGTYNLDTNIFIPYGEGAFIPLSGTTALAGTIDETTDQSGSYTSLSLTNKGYVDSKSENGTWVPTLTADGTVATLANLQKAIYTRIGNIVNWSIAMEVNLAGYTVSNAGIVTITLPIASVFINQFDVIGNVSTDYYGIELWPGFAKTTGGTDIQVTVFIAPTFTGGTYFVTATGQYEILA